MRGAYLIEIPCLGIEQVRKLCDTMGTRGWDVASTRRWVESVPELIYYWMVLRPGTKYLSGNDRRKYANTAVTMEYQEFMNAVAYNEG